MKHKGSVFTNETELLKTLISLHSPNGIELDPMYNKGYFYKEIQKPKFISDLKPLYDYIQKADARNLPYNDNTISSMILDPPFLFNIHGKNGIQRDYNMAKRYSIFENFNSLQETYTQIIKEAYRILKKKGILFFKCQDYTDSKTDLTHCYVWKWAIDQGFYVKDLAILVKPLKIYNSKTTQRHLRKTHTYFFVMVKQ